MSETKRCPFCAEEIQAAAIVCKHCGRDLPKPVAVAVPTKPSGLSSFYLILFVAIMATFGICNALTKYAPTGQSSTRQSLQLDARFAGGRLWLKNIGTEPWSNVMVELNDGFRMRLSQVAAGQEVTLAAMEFANSDGLRFNPFQMKARELYVTADVNGRPGSYGGKFPD